MVMDGKRSRAPLTTPRSSQCERPSGWVEMITSSAPNVRKASSIACSGSPSPTSPRAIDARCRRAARATTSSRSCAAARAPSSSETQCFSGAFSAGHHEHLLGWQRPPSAA